MKHKQVKIILPLVHVSRAREFELTGDRPFNPNPAHESFSSEADPRETHFNHGLTDVEEDD